MSHRHYAIYGLTIASEIALALPERPIGPPDVTILHGEELGDLPRASSIAGDGSEVVMTIAGVGLYRIAAGQSIEVCTAAGTDPGELSLFLLGSAFGVLLQQRGILALHANATSDGQRAVAIAGPSGAGKSTFAAQLCDAGMALLSDDVCAIELVEGEAVALPGIPRVRLWADARERLDWPNTSARRVSPRIEKFEFDAPRFAASPVPLAGIYILERCEAGTDRGFRRLAGSGAVAALMHNSYRGDLLTLTGGQVRHFERCIAIARTVPIFAWRREWGAQHAATDLAGFLEHFRTFE